MDKLRIFLVVLAYSLELMLLCKCEFWCVKISLACFKKAELGETIPNSIFTNGNNTWLLTVLMKNGIEFFKLVMSHWRGGMRMNSKICLEKSKWDQSFEETKTMGKGNILYLLRRSAFRRRHARLPAFVGYILNFRRN